VTKNKAERGSLNEDLKRVQRRAEKKAKSGEKREER
jgi:hypothetical protein